MEVFLGSQHYGSSNLEWTRKMLYLRAMVQGLLPASYCTLDDSPNQVQRNFLVHENGCHFNQQNR